MIRPTPKQPHPPESAAPRPVASAEQWLGRNESEKRRLWERLNPRHRKQLRLLARALVLRQTKGRLPEEAQKRLRAMVEEFERLMTRVEQLLIAIAQRRN